MPNPIIRRRNIFTRMMVPPQHNGTWTLTSRGLSNTPSLGSEVLSNVEFATNTTGWSAANSATLTRRDYSSSPNLAPTGGSDNFGLEISSGGTISAAGSQAPTVTAGTFYQFTARAYSPSANTAVNAAGILLNGAPFTFSATTAEDVWQTVYATARFTGTSGDFRLRCNSATSGDLAHLDAASVKPLTLNQLFAVWSGLANPTSVTARGSIYPGCPVGIVYGLDSLASPATMVLAIHDGMSNIQLLKYVSGTITSLISTSNVYRGSLPGIRRTASTTFQLWCNNAQVGTDQTIADAGTGTLHGVFATNPNSVITWFQAV